ncbi:MAG: hypothetical protein PHT84_02345 [Candidatus Pacebacteria bacterium]|nr:hypothetical protein [Candidatus Paceibacterota bacterium]
MEAILNSEIFFFITSIFVVILTIVLIICGFYLIRIMRNFSHISDQLKKTVDGTVSSLEEVGDSIKESSIFNFFFGKKKRKSSKS